MQKYHLLQESAESLKVLFVENNAGTRLQLSKILKRYFKVVHVCAYADDAIIAFSKYDFDLIITDSHLPDMDAAMICNFINSITITKPIIVVSNIVDPDKMIEYMNSGVSGFIKTPTDEENVIKILSNVVNKIIDRKTLYKFLDENITPHMQPSNIYSNLPPKTNDSLVEINESIQMDTKSMTAKELVEAYPLDLEIVGDKLLLLNDNLDIYLSRFIHQSSMDNALEVASVFENYSFVLRDMDFFSTISLCTQKLSHVFKSLDHSKSFSDYSDLLYSLSASLSRWCDEIFIEQTSPSIYFMDKSIQADVAMIENLFLENENISEEVEFFD